MHPQEPQKKTYLITEMEDPKENTLQNIESATLGITIVTSLGRKG